ncbi:MAG: hypothetical protein PHW60_12170 [Kiritimatiellae bacterium]|nr:hypothetical protein [Kiritimatiellia bacterium]
MISNKNRQWDIQTDAALEQAGAVAHRELLQAIDEASARLTGGTDAARRIRLGLGAKDLPAESYRIESSASESALQISCAGRDKRGLLYAAYDLAERIRHQEPLDRLDVTETPHCTFRQLTAGSSDHEFYRRLIRHMPRWRLNTLLLCSAYHCPHSTIRANFFNTYWTIPIVHRNYPKIKAMTEACPAYQQVREDFPRLLAYAGEHEIDVALKFSLLSYTRMDASGGHYTLDYNVRRRIMREDLPHLFSDGRETPDFDSQSPYDFIREQLEELFDLYPDLAGISAEMAEMATFPLSFQQSLGAGYTPLFTPEQRIRWIVRAAETVEEVCARYGRVCFWDMHGSGNTSLEALLIAAKKRLGGLRLRAESTQIEQTFGDNFPSYPFAKVAEAGDGMADHDVHMEGLCEYPWLPNIADRYGVRHTKAGLDAGLRGGGVMWCLLHPYYSPINDLGAINNELVSRLIWDPEESVDVIWARWLARRFGGKAAPVAGHLLRHTQEVFNGIAYFNNLNACCWFQQNGFPQSLRNADIWVEYFQPAGTPLYAISFCGAARERAVPMAQMRAEKQAALRRAQDLVEYLARHRVDFRACDYRTLLPRYLALAYAARYSAALTEAMWNFVNLHIHAYDPDCSDPRQGLERSLGEMSALYQEMRDDDRLYLLEPDVYYNGFRNNFQDRIQPMVAEFRFVDRALAMTEDTVASLPEAERTQALRIRTLIREQREKFARNARNETPAEELWAINLCDQ